MPPKQTQSSSKGKRRGNAAGNTEGAEEEALAAVILADSFDDRFSPLTLHRPRCLLPFCGVPMINLTLERLLQAGVARVYVLAKAHTQLIKRHIEQVQATGAVSSMDITVFALPEATSVGHAMQDLDRKEVIRGDFLLVQPDAVGNVDLREMVRIHTERKKRDREAIMTIGMMQVAKGARNTPPSANPIVAVRPRTGQLLHWHQPPVEPATTRTSLPFEDLFTQSDADPQSSEVDLRADLRETGIDVCGVEVPPLFSENFDYQKLRRDFVVGILTSDLLDSRLFLHIAPSAPQHATARLDDPSGSAWGYGARCDSTRAFDGVALDVLAGLTWPMSPGCPGWPGERLQVRQAFRYLGTHGVDVDPTVTRLGKSTLVSSRCVVARGADVEQSTLCNGVQIGRDSTVLGSHLFEEAQVGAGCTLTSCIVGRRAKVLDNVRVEAGCIIGDYCVVGPNVTLRAGARVAAKRQGEDEDDEDDEEEVDSPATLPAPGSDKRLGASGVGYLWPALGDGGEGEGGVDGDHSESDSSDSDSDSDDDDPVEAPANLRHLVIGGRARASASTASSVSSIDGDSEFGGSDDDESDSDDDDAAYSVTSSAAPSQTANDLTLNLTEDTHYETQAAVERLREFRAEAAASVLRAFDEGHTIENASIELKTLRMSTNVPLSEVRRIVVELILARCDANDGAATEQWLARWSGLITAVTTGSGEEEGREVIETMQTYCAVHATHTALFVPLLKKFYNDDVVGDDAIVAWWKSAGSREWSGGGDGGDADALKGKDLDAVKARRVELRAKAEAVVRWVVESGDSSSEEEEEDSEDE